jgi:hypothetical protein
MIASLLRRLTGRQTDVAPLQLGTDPSEVHSSALAKSVDKRLSQFFKSQEGKAIFALYGVELPELEHDVTSRKGEYRTRQLATVQASGRRVFAETGRPGTYVVGGKVMVEPNAKLRPYQARGRLSRPGIYDELYSTDTLLMKSDNEISGLINSAVYELEYPASLPEGHSVREVAERCHKNIQRVCGYDWRKNARTFIRRGFCVFEEVWRRDNDFVKLEKLAFREQSTVYEWLYDANLRELVGAEFRPMLGQRSTREEGGDTPASYILRTGDTPETSQLFHLAINDVGLNVEGIPPYRPCVGLRKLKELIFSIWGVSYQKFGSPIPLAVVNLVGDMAAIQQSASDKNNAELQRLINRLDAVRAQVAGGIPVPAGYGVQFVSPTGDMPDPKPMLDLIDHQMAMAFSNEGAVLGTNGIGSYAMASQKDVTFMRSAPSYAAVYINAFDRLLHKMLRWNYPDFNQLEELPKYQYRFAGAQDASAFAADLFKLAQSKIWEFSEPVRHNAAIAMNLPANAFDTRESTFATLEEAEFD